MKLMTNRTISIVLAALALLSLTNTNLLAAEKDADDVIVIEEGVKGFCEWVLGIAESESAVLMSPDIYAIASPTFSGSEETGDESKQFDQLVFRINAGLQYNFINLYRGHVTRKRAKAECNRYKLASALNRYLVVGKDLGRRRALESTIAFLEKSIKKGSTFLEKRQKEFAAKEIGIAELYAFEVKVDALKQQYAKAKTEMAQIARLPALPSSSMKNLMNELKETDLKVEKFSAKLRKSAAWNVDVRGGYYQTFGAEQELPLFALLRVSYNFGGLFQNEAEGRAEIGRHTWLKSGLDSTIQKAEALRQQLKILVGSQQDRLGFLTKRVEKIRNRIAAISDSTSLTVNRYKELLTLDLLALEAELIFANNNVEDVKNILTHY